MSELTASQAPVTPAATDNDSPSRTSPFLRAAGWQLILTFLSMLILDGGIFARVFVLLSLAFWAGVLLMIWRRRESLSRTDSIHLKYGLLLAFIVAFPISGLLSELSGSSRHLMQTFQKQGQ